MPGEKLPVAALAHDLDCSRVPVMEALKRLAAEGFVHIVPQVGRRMVSPRSADVKDFFAVFVSLEGTVTGFPAARRTGADLAEFEDVCARVDSGTARAGGPGVIDPAYRRLNLLFHSWMHYMARSAAPNGSDLKFTVSGVWQSSDVWGRRNVPAFSNR